MKFLLAVSLTSFCLVLVSAPFIRRRETIEKLVEFNVAVPSLLKLWQQGSMYPIGSTMRFVNGLLFSLMLFWEMFRAFHWCLPKVV